MEVEVLEPIELSPHQTDPLASAPRRSHRVGYPGFARTQDGPSVLSQLPPYFSNSHKIASISMLTIEKKTLRKRNGLGSTGSLNEKQP